MKMDIAHLTDCEELTDLRLAIDLRSERADGRVTAGIGNQRD